MDIRGGSAVDRPLAALSIEKGPGAGTDLPITAPVVSIGRSAQNDLVIDEDSVSARHARLEYRSDGWGITDLGSANGTFVEDVRLAPDVANPLMDRASVRFGAVHTRFVPVPGADPGAALDSHVPPPARQRVADRRSRARIPLWLILLLIILIAVVWFGLVWTPEPTTPPEPAVDGPAIGMTSFAPPAPGPA